MVPLVSLKGGAYQLVVDVVVTQVVVLHVGTDVVGHLGPPVVPGDKLEGLEAACMSGDVRIVVLFNDTMP
jgi:hypothetical protein